MKAAVLRPYSVFLTCGAPVDFYMMKKQCSPPASQFAKFGTVRVSWSSETAACRAVAVAHPRSSGGIQPQALSDSDTGTGGSYS